MRADWVEVVLGDLGTVVSGGTPKTEKADYWGGDIIWITPADLSGYTSKYISKGRKSVTSLGLKNSSAKLIPPNSLVFSCRAPIGYVAITTVELSTNQGFKNLIPHKNLSVDFLYYYLKFAKHLAEERASGTTFKELSAKAFANLPTFLAPLPEQRAIVAKIEQLFSDLDNGIANLKAAQAKLDLYRQSVLKQAFEGEWGYKKIEEIIDSLDQGWSPACEKVPAALDEWGVIKTTAIQFGVFLQDENKKLPLNLTPRAQHEIKENDILITRAGPRSRVGVCCLVKKTRAKLINCDKVYRIRVNQVLPEYFVLLMNSPAYLEKMESTKSGINDSGVNLKQNIFVNMLIPIPSIEEQTQIVQEIEARLSVCDKLADTIQTSLQQAEALCQSILKKAFEGRLLTETELQACQAEADWMPAEQLLAKMKENPS